MTGNAEILAYTTDLAPLPNMLQLIEVAGRTCYKSTDKITTDSATKFIRKILRRGHESVIEHSWIVLKIPSVWLRNIPNPLLIIDPVACQRNDLVNHSFAGQYGLVSGNIRMWRDCLKMTNDQSQLYRSLLLALREIIPELFSDFPSYTDDPAYIISVTADRSEIATELIMKHCWAMVRFTGCSRAFTHQLVRHRLCAFSQESQRYCDETGFVDNDYFVTPPSIIKAGLEKSYQSHMRAANDAYASLRDALKAAGYAKASEDARFVLPNAVCSEIVTSAPLYEWRHIFKMRCDSHAQWEIRARMMQLLREFQNIWSPLFDDFVINEDGESAKYTPLTT